MCVCVCVYIHKLSTDLEVAVVCILRDISNWPGQQHTSLVCLRGVKKPSLFPHMIILRLGQVLF